MLMVVMVMAMVMMIEYLACLEICDLRVGSYSEYAIENQQAIE